MKSISARITLVLAILSISTPMSRAFEPAPATSSTTSAIPVKVGKDYFVGFPKGFSGSDDSFPIEEINGFRILDVGSSGWCRVALLGGKELAGNESVWVNFQYALSIREITERKK